MAKIRDLEIRKEKMILELEMKSKEFNCLNVRYDDEINLYSENYLSFKSNINKRRGSSTYFLIPKNLWIKSFDEVKFHRIDKLGKTILVFEVLKGTVEG
jgi:hypothetical protein